MIQSFSVQTVIGFELTDDQLMSLSGTTYTCSPGCPAIAPVRTGRYCPECGREIQSSKSYVINSDFSTQADTIAPGANLQSRILTGLLSGSPQIQLRNGDPATVVCLFKIWDPPFDNPSTFRRVVGFVYLDSDRPSRVATGLTALVNQLNTFQALFFPLADPSLNKLYISVAVA